MRPVPPPGDIAASASATLSLRPPPVSSETPSDSFLKVPPSLSFYLGDQNLELTVDSSIVVFVLVGYFLAFSLYIWESFVRTSCIFFFLSNLWLLGSN